jgi:radical SAM family uncharacterized protein/radical SAM-linked protein
MDLARVIDEEILPHVEKPSRYLGNEVNAVRRDPASVDVHMALCFPDLYDLGLGNLGLHILYAIVNGEPWAACERVYAPAKDMESELRTRGLPLFTLETRTPLHQLDLLGFTLQTELTYTNILNAIDLGGIPLRSADRGDQHPIVIAGGPAVFNPEPLSPFVDAFLIGDGEDAIREITAALRGLRGTARSRRLDALAGIPGLYIPARTPFVTRADGWVVPAGGTPKIRKRLTRDLNGATFPVATIVPFTQQVHDRVNLEVLRGCTQGCRFCQAGMVTRPVRERKLEQIDELLTRTLDATGYEEVSLVSLSTCDYSRVRQLVENTVETARPRRVAVSLPSLRLDSFSVELADMVAETRRTGLTVAPEAASPRLRQVINKWIPDEDLLEMARGAFSRGWDHIKLYFMIGLPTERDDDILAIADLAHRCWQVGKAASPNGKAKIHLGVSTFVPKPFTPFQWAAQIPFAETVRRQDILEAELRRIGAHGVKFGRHDPEETFLEGVLSRSDRRAGDVLERAFRLGARFDAWREHLRMDVWEQAIAECGFDVPDTLRERPVDEVLPWDHLDVLVERDWLAADWARALELKHAADCRRRKCHDCGVIDVERPLCAAMLRDHVKARPLESAWKRKDNPPPGEPPAVQRLWLRISRTGNARFLAHLEAMNAWARALRRAKAPLSYTQGFHPHPKMAFSAAMPQNEESVGEYMDVTLTARVDPEALREALAATAPEGFAVTGVREVPLNSPSLMSLVQGAEYTIWFPGETAESLSERVAALLGQDAIAIGRKGKTHTGARGRRRNRVVNDLDIRPMIRHLAVRQGPGVPGVDLTVVSVGGKPGKPREIVGMLTDRPEAARVFKRDTLALVGGEVVSLSQA